MARLPVCHATNCPNFMGGFLRGLGCLAEGTTEALLAQWLRSLLGRNYDHGKESGARDPGISGDGGGDRERTAARAAVHHRTRGALPSDGSDHWRKRKRQGTDRPRGASLFAALAQALGGS